MKTRFDTPFAELPSTIPIFPVHDSILLPGGKMALDIFEEKYINLILDALRNKSRLVGIIMNKDIKSKTKPGQGNNRSNLFTMGCAGRITAFEETVEGSILVVITGYCRFRVMQYLPVIRGYQIAKVDWNGFSKDTTIEPDCNIDRNKTIDQIEKFSKKLNISMDWDVVNTAPSYSIITFFSMNLPFSTAEKQTLLEAATPEERNELMLSFIKQNKAKK